MKREEFIAAIGRPSVNRRALREGLSRILDVDSVDSTYAAQSRLALLGFPKVNFAEQPETFMLFSLLQGTLDGDRKSEEALLQAEGGQQLLEVVQAVFHTMAP